MSSSDLKSVQEIALELGKLKQSIFKIIKRLGIEIKKQRDSSRRNQFVAFVAHQDYLKIKEEIASRTAGSSFFPDANGRFADSDESGVFYLIQLEPDHDPGRYKVGFAVNMQDRLKVHRCSAPFSKVVKKWPCKRLWEKTAIDCITSGCARLHTEVFRADSIDPVVSKADAFFSIMPDLRQENKKQA